MLLVFANTYFVKVFGLSFLPVFTCLFIEGFKGGKYVTINDNALKCKISAPLAAHLHLIQRHLELSRIGFN